MYSRKCVNGTAMKRYIRTAVVIGFLLMLVGCTALQTQEKNAEMVDFTVVEMRQIPKALKEIIEKNKKQEIRMSYSDGDELYLIRGYGEQKTGGYSIVVKSCTEDEELLCLNTQLLGPQKEAVSADPSYPCLVIKMKIREKEMLID